MRHTVKQESVENREEMNQQSIDVVIVFRAFNRFANRLQSNIVRPFNARSKFTSNKLLNESCVWCSLGFVITGLWRPRPPPGRAYKMPRTQAPTVDSGTLVARAASTYLSRGRSAGSDPP